MSGIEAEPAALTVEGTVLVDLTAARSLPGRHNAQNAAFAYATARALGRSLPLFVADDGLLDHGVDRHAERLAAVAARGAADRGAGAVLRHRGHGGPALHRRYGERGGALDQSGAVQPAAVRVRQAGPDRLRRLDVRRGPEGRGRARRQHRVRPVGADGRPVADPAGHRPDPADYHHLHGRLLHGRGAAEVGGGVGGGRRGRGGVAVFHVQPHARPPEPLPVARDDRHPPDRPRVRGDPRRGPGRARHRRGGDETPRSRPAHRLHLFRRRRGVRPGAVADHDRALRLHRHSRDAQGDEAERLLRTDGGGGAVHADRAAGLHQHRGEPESDPDQGDDPALHQLWRVRGRDRGGLPDAGAGAGQGEGSRPAGRQSGAAGHPRPVRPGLCRADGRRADPCAGDGRQPGRPHPVRDHAARAGGSARSHPQSAEGAAAVAARDAGGRAPDLPRRRDRGRGRPLLPRHGGSVVEGASGDRAGWGLDLFGAGGGGPAVGADPAEDRHGRPSDPERAGAVRGGRGEGDRRGRPDGREPDGDADRDPVRSGGAGGHVVGRALGGDPGCGAAAGGPGGAGGQIDPSPLGGEGRRRSLPLAAGVGGGVDHHRGLRLHRLGGQSGGVRPAEAGGAQPRRFLEGDAEARPAEGADRGDDHRPGPGRHRVAAGPGAVAVHPAQPAVRLHPGVRLDVGGRGGHGRHRPPEEVQHGGGGQPLRPQARHPDAHPATGRGHTDRPDHPGAGAADHSRRQAMGPVAAGLPC
uniref:Glycosyltransferase n=1 Tax=Parastrongyloides trichosuri TaxID=131310 RepID=A0A0N5A0A0_PARTI